MLFYVGPQFMANYKFHEFDGEKNVLKKLWEQGWRHHTSWGGVMYPLPFSNFSVFTVLNPPPPSN